MSHYSRSDYDGRGRSSSRSRVAQPPVVYSTTRRSSSVGGGHTSPNGYYSTSESGRVRRNVSAERHGTRAYGGSGYSQSGSGYSHVSSPSSAGQYQSRQRRSSSSSHQAPVYYAAPASTTYTTRPRSRSGAEAYHQDPRRSHHGHHQDVRVISMADQSHARPRQRSRSVESRRSTQSRRSSHEGESFGDKMKRMFGLGHDQHETRKHTVYYEDPRTHRRAVSNGKACRTREMQYMDARTGREVDREGRPIYTV